MAEDTAGAITPARAVHEERLAGGVPLYVHPEWRADFPWLMQGTTARGDGIEPFDLGLSGTTPVGAALDRWRALRAATGFGRAVHARQVHGAELLRHDGGPAGTLVTEGYDGHLTMAADVLLTVSVADCVPIFLVDPERRAIAALHGGWRGVVAGILERGVALLGDVARSSPATLRMHVGPAICGDCYEVGPEVHEALGLERPATNTPVDLRAVLATRARALGLGPDHITTSAHCTRCGDSPFFSHRGGDPERQMGVLGLRAG